MLGCHLRKAVFHEKALKIDVLPLLTFDIFTNWACFKWYINNIYLYHKNAKAQKNTLKKYIYIYIIMIALVM